MPQALRLAGNTELPECHEMDAKKNTGNYNLQLLNYKIYGILSS
jgi:hypothetical protein